MECVATDFLRSLFKFQHLLNVVCHKKTLFSLVQQNDINMLSLYFFMINAVVSFCFYIMLENPFVNPWTVMPHSYQRRAQPTQVFYKWLILNYLSNDISIFSVDIDFWPYWKIRAHWVLSTPLPPLKGISQLRLMVWPTTC